MGPTLGALAVWHFYFIIKGLLTHYPTAHPVAAARPRLARGPTSSSGGALGGGQSCRACRRACYRQGAWWEGCACCGVWHASESGHQRLECAAAEVRQVRNGVRKYCGWGSMGAYRCLDRSFLWRCGSTWQHRGHLQHTGPAQESCGRNLSPPWTASHQAAAHN